MKIIALTSPPASTSWYNSTKERAKRAFMRIFFYGLIILVLLYLNQRMNELENALMFESSSTIEDLIIDHQWEITQLKKRLDNGKFNQGI